MLALCGSWLERDCERERICGCDLKRVSVRECERVVGWVCVVLSGRRKLEVLVC